MGRRERERVERGELKTPSRHTEITNRGRVGGGRGGGRKEGAGRKEGGGRKEGAGRGEGKGRGEEGTRKGGQAKKESNRCLNKSSLVYVHSPLDCCVYRGT